MRRHFDTLILILPFILAGISQAAQESQKLRFRFLDVAGKPIPAAQVGRFHCGDMSDEPIPARTYVHDGYATVVLPGQPFQVCALINVPDFGEVVIYADNAGKGYSKAGWTGFVKEAAVTRRLRVKSALKQAEADGVRMSEGFYQRLQTADKESDYKSLAITLKAGEDLAVARARHRIARWKGHPRAGFIFGCNAFGYPLRGPIYQARFREVFNLGITNVYLSHYAPTETTRNYDRTDNETSWLLSNGMAVKPCPPFYMASSVTPEWLKNRPYPEVKRIAHDLVKEVAARYKDKTRFCEIMNEAHDYSNSLRLTPDELTDLAGVTSKAAKEGDPKVQRIINSCHLWGEYAGTPTKDGKYRRSPYAYLRDCIRAGVEFEIVGLQMYYPEYDLFETDRLLDKFAKLGKPIQLTEMGCSSAPGIDPNAQRKRASAGWHGPWTEQMQADWVEGIYTIAYSKPYVEGVSWWDLADAVSFWPYGGLLRGDCSPKPAYLRLRKLQETWGF
jgi:endo-1,4-beta-xylanase